MYTRPNVPADTDTGTGRCGFTIIWCTDELNRCSQCKYNLCSPIYTPHSSSPLSCSPRPGRSPRSGSLNYFRAFMTLPTRGGSFVEKPHTRLKTITPTVVCSFLNLNWKTVCATAQVMRSSLRLVVAWTFFLGHICCIFSNMYSVRKSRCSIFWQLDQHIVSSDEGGMPQSAL